MLCTEMTHCILSNVLVETGEGCIIGVVLYLVFCRWFPPKVDPPGADRGGDGGRSVDTRLGLKGTRLTRPLEGEFTLDPVSGDQVFLPCGYEESSGRP